MTATASLDLALCYKFNCDAEGVKYGGTDTYISTSIGNIGVLMGCYYHLLVDWYDNDTDSILFGVLVPSIDCFAGG